MMLTEKPYALNWDWAQHAESPDDAWFTLQITIVTRAPAACGLAMDRWLADWTPGWRDLQGDVQLVAYHGGVFVTIDAASPVGGLPVLLLHSHGQDACDSIADEAQDLYDAIRVADEDAKFIWAERPPQ